MNKRGWIIGLMLVALMGLVFQSELAGFVSSVRERASDAAAADEAVVATMPELAESELTPLPESEGGIIDTEAGGEATEEETEATASPVAYREVTLYFVDTASGEMTSEERSIINQNGVARATLTELLSGPSSSSLSSYIPVGTEILDIAIDSEGLCTVDFSHEIQEAELDSREERMVIESIVDTLAQFDTVQAVQIRVDGQTCQSLTGHWDISEPISVAEL